MNRRHFEDAIRNAISIGGDSDTIAAITGAIAEAYYGVPDMLKRRALTYLDSELRGIFREWDRAVNAGQPVRRFDFITKYIGKLEDSYNRLDFYQEFFILMEQNHEDIMVDFQTILEDHGLSWTEASMKAAHIPVLTERETLALIFGVYRAEHFSEGVAETFISERHIERWLGRLKEIDDEREPESDKPVLKQVRMCLKPFNNKGDVSELLVTENQVKIESSSSEGVHIVHQFEIGAVSDLGEICLGMMADCLDAASWYDSPLYDDIGFAINRYELEAEYEDGEAVIHKGSFDRAHIPEREFTAFVNTVRIIIHTFGFGGIVGLSGFMFALKKGEVKYCGVEFSDSGRIYHYRTTDLRIDVGDKVIVPVGENDYERRATVRTIEFCRWDDTPYPLESTKEIIRLVGDEA